MTLHRTRLADPSLDHVLSILRARMAGLREMYQVKSLGVFGSYVPGGQRKQSDVDIFVEYQEAPSLFRFIDLQEYLSELLGVKVDLVMRTALRPAIGERILDEVVVV